jgi:hypothetical protein
VNGFGLALFGGVLLAVLWVLVWLSKKSAFVSLATGLALLAVPVAQWATFDRRYFHSDGSSAGLVIFAVYALVGFFCGVVGFTLAASAITRFALGEVSKRNRIIFFCAAGTVLIGMQVYGLYGRDYLAQREIAALRRAAKDQPKQEKEVARKVTVRDSYALSWTSRGRVPALRLAVPAADFVVRDRRDPDPWVEETKDGVVALELALPWSAGQPRLTLHRDDPFAEDILGTLDDSRYELPAIWVSTQGGGWKLLGLECSERALDRYPAARSGGSAGAGKGPVPCYAPSDSLMRRLPRLYDLERVRVHSGDTSKTRSGCTTAFRYRERLAWIETGDECPSPETLPILAAAADLLDRLGRDTQIPPDAATRLARAKAATEDCEAARKALRLDTMDNPSIHRAAAGIESSCARSVRLAAAELKVSPAEASVVLLRAIEARGDLPPQDLPYLDQIVAAFAAAGRGDTRDMLWAHVVRHWHFESKATEETRKAAAVSMRSMLAAAPSLAADDPLWPRFSRILSFTAPEDQEAARKIAILAAWDRKVAAEYPGSDIALMARYRVCVARHGARLERESLGACADDLLAAWQARVAAGRPLGILSEEAAVAQAVGGMYFEYAQATQEFARGVAGIRRVREFATARIPPMPAYTDALDSLRRMEQSLAARTGARTGAS